MPAFVCGVHKKLLARKMYKPAVIGNLYGDTLTPATGRISNTLIAFFILIQFAFGLDCGFTNWFNKKYSGCLKYVTLGVTSWVLLVHVAPFKKFVMPIGLWDVITLFSYVSYVLTFRFAKLSVYNFLFKINLVSCKTGGKSKEIFGAIGIIYMITIFVTKLAFILSYCADFEGHCDAYIVPYTIVAIYSCCSDIVPIIMAVIAYHELWSVTKVRQTLEKPELNVDVTKKLYIAVANEIDEIRPLYHNMVSYLICKDFLN